GELVAEFGDALVAHRNLREFRAVLTLHQRYRIHDAGFARTHRHARLAAFLGTETAHVVGFFEESRRTGLPEQHGALVDFGFGIHETILVEMGVGLLAARAAHVVVRNFEAVLLPAGIPAFLAL